jgi:hypothetical protein
MRPAKVLHKAEIAKCPGGGWGMPAAGGRAAGESGKRCWRGGDAGYSRLVIVDAGESGNYAPEGVHLRP